ncbi:RNA-directed DNA polymerase [Desulfobacter vibrioformis]|uniref:RNA-directed DNA polymerase n=1 Tax=Desulfobacter vibrioformis TaxID=34031 RepID=UPI00055101C3|nr:RNA-directed DNA polymerase [Desulfobacter vibrioformis]
MSVPGITLPVHFTGPPPASGTAPQYGLLSRILMQGLPGSQITSSAWIFRYRISDGLSSIYHVRPGKGLPIGTLTSQHFANFYLDRLDRFVMESCRARACVRYMYDMIFWCDTKASARLLLKNVRWFVETPLLLTVKNSQVQIRKSNCGVLFCGYRIYPGVIRLSQRKKRRYIRLRKKWEQWFANGMISESELARGYDAVSASLCHADSRQWRKLQLKKSGAPVW